MSGRREKKPIRQLSLDCTIKNPFRRQISEDLVSKTAIQAGRQLKIAWALEKSEPESDQVEIVAKKCGQPKPKPAVRPPRSPFAPDENTVLFSRQQLTERLRSSWQKNSGSRHNLDIFLNRSMDSECSDAGGSLPKTPDDTESSDNETEEALHCLHATHNNVTPTMMISSQSESSANNSSNKLCASARRMNFRNMGRQRSILESPCPTPDPSKVSPPTFRNISRQRVGDSSSSCASTPEPRKQLPRMMSAPPRSVPPSSANRKLAKVPSMETRCPTPISLTQRIKSAPPKRKLKSSKRRGGKTGGGGGGGDSSDDGKEGAKGQSGKCGVRRGVDRGEVVTMVSLVSPAGTDSDEPTCVPIPPSTPRPTATADPAESKEEPKPTPPPPIICLRKPPKSVTFRPSVVVPSSGSQYQTNFALRRSAILTHQSSLPAQPSLPSAGQNNKLLNNNRAHGGGTQRTGGQQRTGGGSTAQSSPTVQPVQQQTGVVLSRAPPPVVRKRVVQDNSKLQQPVKEGTDKDVIPIIINSNTLETSRRTTISAASNSNLQQTANSSTTIAASTIVLSPTIATTTTTTAAAAATTNGAIDPAKPDFKSPKEKECWDLFKKMSERGLSVSFETVLRGLLTPTEYRMRKTALLSVC